MAINLKRLRGGCVKKLWWQIIYTKQICKRFHDYRFWKWWWISEAAAEDDSWVEQHPEDAADEELTYWND